MDIQIKESGEIKKLIIRDKNGIDWSADLVDRRNIEGFNDDNIPIMTQDNFGWWENYIIGYEQTAEEIEELIDELIDANLDCPLNHIDCPDKDYCWKTHVEDRVNEATGGRDMDGERKAAIAELESIREEFLK